VLGAVIAVHETWTLVAWLADGPHRITQYQDRDSASWFLAHTFEVLAAVFAVGMIVHLVRDCRRQGRFLTFDMMFVLCCFSFFPYFEATNFFLPTFLLSSNFITLNNPCGHWPLVVNPDCGRVPDAAPFFILVCTFGILGLAMLAPRVLAWVQRRRPGLSTARTVMVALMIGLVFELLFEGIAIRLGLWTYTISPGIEFGPGLRLAYVEIVAATFFWGLLVAVRLIKNDKGQTLVERGLERHSPGVRKGITFLALYGYCMFVALGPGTVPLWINGFYEPPWGKMPAHVLNGVCDLPDVASGTRYGPCPGSPGYRMPGRHSLPGKSP
jgi:hypothetical protein